MNNCFSCGKSGHKMRDCPNLKSQDKGSGQAQASGSSDAPKKNRFYALRSRGEKENSPDLVYALIDIGATLSFVTPLVANKFDVLFYILHESFLVSTTVEESVVAKRVYQNCPISLPNRVSYVDLIELDMPYIDIILCMDWLH